MNPINAPVRINYDLSGNPKAEFPPGVGNRTRVIYAIYQDGVKRPLNVGKTGPIFRKRVSAYISAINKYDSGMPVGKLRSILIGRLAKNVGKIYFRIVAQATEKESLSDLETRMIALHKPIINHNKGGGGGSSMLSPSFKSLPLAPRHNGSPITPKKNYRFMRIKGKIKTMFSPEGKKQSGIYRIKKESTGERYIGQTNMTLAKRVSSHTSCANADDAFVIKSNLHKMMADDPEDFTVGIVRAVESGHNLDQLEDDIIEHAKTIGSVLNKRKGGGGSKPSAKKICT